MGMQAGLARPDLRMGVLARYAYAVRVRLLVGYLGERAVGSRVKSSSKDREMKQKKTCGEFDIQRVTVWVEGEE